MAETKDCPYCGEEILAVAKKCKHCGEWLDGSHQKKQETPEKTLPKAEVKSQQPVVTPQQPMVTPKKPKNNLIIYGIIGLAIIVAIVLALTLSNSDSSSAKKIYVTDLECKTETTSNSFGTSSWEYYYDKKGNKFDGEAWLKSDLECLSFGDGFPYMCSFYYPNGQLAVCDATDADGNRLYYDSNGNEITPEEFREVYVKLYGSKLVRLSALEEMIENNCTPNSNRNEEKEVVYVDEYGNSWYVAESGDTLMVEN